MNNKPVKFAFCLSDSTFSPTFLKQWVNLCSHMNKNKIAYVNSQGTSCNAFYARAMSLGANVLNGSYQRPFQGRVDCEYIVFINGKLNFEVQDIFDLYKYAHTLNSDFISITPQSQKRYKPIDDDEQQQFTTVEYVELDLALIRPEVFENIQYPWFTPHAPQTQDQQDLVDVEFCRKLREHAGIDLVCDRTITRGLSL